MKKNLLLLFAIVWLQTLLAQAPGSLLTTFGTGGAVLKKFSTGTADFRLAEQTSDKKIVTVGFFKNANALDDAYVWKFNEDGSNDNTFGTNGQVLLGALIATSENLTINTVEVLASGKIIVAGQTKTVTGGLDAIFIQLNSNGTLDTSFGVNGKVVKSLDVSDDVADLKITSTGKIMAVGTTGSGNNYNIVLYRLNSSGTFDNTFGTNGTTVLDIKALDFMQSLVIQPDGKILLAGRTGTTTVWNFVVVRVTANGVFDTTFNTVGYTIVSMYGSDFGQKIVLEPNGKIILAGYAATSNGQRDYAVTRLNSNGTLDNTFNSTGKSIISVEAYDYLSSAMLQTDGKIILTGFSVGTSSTATNNSILIRLNSNGERDVTFGTNGVSSLDIENKGLHDGISAGFMDSNNNIVMVGATASNGYIGKVVSGQSSPNALKAKVTFTVDTKNMTPAPTAMNLAGSFQGWNPSTGAMAKIAGTSLWTKTLDLGKDSTFQYKFVNGTTYETITGACTVGATGNRSVKVNKVDTSLATICFAQCTVCSAPSYICNPKAIICDDFEKYTLGNISPQSPNWEVWTGAFDAEVTNTKSSSGLKSMYVNKPGQDVILRTADYTKGSYELSWKTYIPSGRYSYTGILHEIFPSGDNEVGAEIFYSGLWTEARLVLDGSTQGYYPITPDKWFNVSFKVNLDVDSAYLKIGDNPLIGFEYSTSSNFGVKQFSGIDFYGGSTTSTNVYEYYVDDVEFVNTSTSRAKVTFQVDTKEITPAPTAMNFVGLFPGWNTANAAMTKIAGSTIWTKTIELGKDTTYEYKFANGTTNEIITGTCKTSAGNRSVKTLSDVILNPVCFTACTKCLAPPLICDPKAKICDDFEKYTLTELNPQAAHWSVWPGSDDGFVSDKESSSGAKSLLIDAVDQDVFFDTGDTHTKGQHEVKFKMFIPKNARAYIGTLQQIIPNIESSMYMDFKLNGDVEIEDQNFIVKTLPYLNDAWFDVSLKIDLDKDSIGIKIGNNPVFMAQFSTTGSPALKQFAGVEFWGGFSTGYKFYIDDVQYISTTSTKSQVTFKVDTKNIIPAPTAMSLAGSFQGWNPANGAMTKIPGTSIWTKTVALGKDTTYEYKFVNGTTYEIVPSSCAKGTTGNRFIKAPKTDTTLSTVCFALCTKCLAPPLVCDLKAKICDDFEKYTIGALDPQAVHWTVWEDSEDGVVTGEESSSGVKSLLINKTDQDVVFDIGNQTAGLHEMRWKMFIPSNERAYAALLQETNALGDNESGVEFFFRSPAFVDIQAKSTTLISLAYPNNTWFEISAKVDLKKDSAYIKVGSNPVFACAYSSSGFAALKQLAGMDFWGGFSTNYKFYVDDVQWIENTPKTYKVTFTVDMAEQAIEATGVHIAGNFQKAAGLPLDWTPAQSKMTLVSGKKYTVSYNVPDGKYEYKFVNGNTWGKDEKMTGKTCGLSTGNRGFEVNGKDLLVPEFCYNKCYTCNIKEVTFNVDMSTQVVSANGVYLAGSFQKAAGFPTDWDPSSIKLKDLGNKKIYSISVPIPAGSYEYKFINDNNWTTGKDEKVAGSCAAGTTGNRKIVIANDVKLDSICFNYCVKCSKVDVNDPVLLSKLNINPNPAMDFITVNFDADLDVLPSSVELLNVNGQIIFRTDFEQQQTATKINVNNIASGLYFVKVYFDKPGNTLIKRVVIQH